MINTFNTFNTPINYLPENIQVREEPLEWQKRGLQQTSSGYGNKLTTSVKVFYNNKWYRVYCTCHSNVGSYWIIANGQKLFMH